MTGPEEAKGQSTQQHSDPTVSSPVGQNNAMEGKPSGSDKRRASDLSAKPTKAANTPQLAGPESADDFIGWTLTQRPCCHSKFIVQSPKVWVSKHRNSWQRKHHKSNTKVTLLVVASCPDRKNPLTSLCFLLFIKVLTWKWRWHDGRKKEEDE